MYHTLLAMTESRVLELRPTFDGVAEESPATVLQTSHRNAGHLFNSSLAAKERQARTPSVPNAETGPYRPTLTGHGPASDSFESWERQFLSPRVSGESTSAGQTSSLAAGGVDARSSIQGLRVRRGSGQPAPSTIFPPAFGSHPDGVKLSATPRVVRRRGQVRIAPMSEDRRPKPPRPEGIFFLYVRERTRSVEPLWSARLAQRPYRNSLYEFRVSPDRHRGTLSMNQRAPGFRN